MSCSIPSMIQQWHSFDEYTMKTIQTLHNYILFEEKTHKSHKSEGKKLKFQFQNAVSGKILDFCFVIDLSPPNPNMYVSQDNIIKMLINHANALISILCDKTKTKIFIQGKTYSQNQNDFCSYPTWCKNDLNVVNVLPGQILNDDDLSRLTRDVIKENDVSSLKQIMVFKPDMLNRSMITYKTSIPFSLIQSLLLQFSAQLLQLDCIQLLLELKSNVNEKQHNSTPLEMALKHDVMDQTLFGFPTGPPSYNNQREKKQYNQASH